MINGYLSRLGSVRWWEFGVVARTVTDLCVEFGVEGLGAGRDGSIGSYIGRIKGEIVPEMPYLDNHLD